MSLLYFLLVLCLLTTTKINALTVYNISTGSCQPISSAAPTPSHYNVWYSFPLTNDIIESNSLQPLVQNGNGGFSACGEFGSCWQGAGGLLNFPPVFFPLGSSYSILMWVNTAQNGTLISTLYASSVYSIVTNITILPDNLGTQLFFYQGNTDQFALIATTNVSFTSGFLHLAFTFNGTLDLASIYVNGTLIEQNYFLPTWTASLFLNFGYIDSYNQGYTGQLFCLLLWLETALDDADIAAILLSQLNSLSCTVPAYIPSSIFQIPRSSSSSSSTGTFLSSSTGSNVNISTLTPFAMYIMNTFGNSIVLFYPMNDPISATFLQDYSFRNNPGILNPPLSYYTLQLPSIVYQNNGSIGFSGNQGNFVYSTYNQIVDPSFSIQIWFSTTTLEGGGFVSWVANDGTTQPVLWLLTNGALVFGCDNVILYPAPSNPPSNIVYNNGQTYLLTATSSSANGLTLYINDQFLASLSSTHCTSDEEVNWIIGLWNAVESPFPFPNSTNLQSVMSNFILYNIELSFTDIQQTYWGGAKIASIYSSTIQTSSSLVENNGQIFYVTVRILTPTLFPIFKTLVYLSGLDTIQATVIPDIPQATDSNGEAIFQISCNVQTGPCQMNQETTVTITASANSFTYGNQLNQTVQVTFIFVPYFIASPLSVEADNVSVVTVTAYLVNSNNVPIPSQNLQLAADKSLFYVSPSVVQSTDMNGKVVWNLTSNIVETLNLSVIVVVDEEPFPNNIVVDFITPTTDASRSTLVAQPSSIPADSGNIYVTVQLLTTNGGPLVSHTVFINWSGASKGLTNSTGFFTWSLFSSTIQNQVVTCEDLTDSIVLDQTANVQFF